MAENRTRGLAIRAGDKVELVPERLAGTGLEDLAGRELVVLGATEGGGRMYLSVAGRAPFWADADQVRRRGPSRTARPEPGPRIVRDENEDEFHH